MDTDAIEAAGATPIRPALDAIDHASDKAALTRAIGALKPIDMGPDVFDIAVFGDPKNPGTNVVHLEQSGIGLPDEAYYREDHYAPIREAYVDMVAKQLRLAGYGDEETPAHRRTASSMSRPASPRTTGTTSPRATRRRPTTRPISPR